MAQERIDVTRSSPRPGIDAQHLAMLRRAKAMSPEERLTLLDRLCRELTALARDAKRIR